MCHTHIMKTCLQCQETKPVTDFTINDKKRGYYHPRCKTCMAANKREERHANPDKYNEYQREWYDKNKDWMAPHYRQANLRQYYKVKDEIFHTLGSRCSRCGYQDWSVLQIDHVFGGGGKERAKYGYTKTFYKIREELRAGTDEGQYQLLCANCHQRKSRVQ